MLLPLEMFFFQYHFKSSRRIIVNFNSEVLNKMFSRALESKYPLQEDLGCQDVFTIFCHFL